MSRTRKRIKKTNVRRSKRRPRYKHNKTKKMKRPRRLNTPKGGMLWTQHTALVRLPIFTDVVYSLLYDNPHSPHQWYDRNVNSEYVREAAVHFQQAFLLLGETSEFELPRGVQVNSVDSMVEALHRWASVKKGIVTGALQVLEGRMPRGKFQSDYKTKIIHPIIQILPTRLRRVLPEETPRDVLMRARETPGIKNYKLKRNIEESERYYKQQEDRYKQHGERSKSKLSEVQRQQRLLSRMSSTL